MAAGESAGKENVTSARPLLNARPEPTFVAVTDVGAVGSKKSFDDCDTLPAFLPLAIFLSPLYFNYFKLSFKISINDPSICCSLKDSSR